MPEHDNGTDSGTDSGATGRGPSTGLMGSVPGAGTPYHPTACDSAIRWPRWDGTRAATPQGTPSSPAMTRSDLAAGTAETS